MFPLLFLERTCIKSLLIHLFLKEIPLMVSPHSHFYLLLYLYLGGWGESWAYRNKWDTLIRFLGLSWYFCPPTSMEKESLRPSREQICLFQSLISKVGVPSSISLLVVSGSPDAVRRTLVWSEERNEPTWAAFYSWVKSA
jgi:hypothetical protein